MNLYDLVRERDGACIDCGGYPVEVHHVISRGRKHANDVRNMVCLCANCHRLKDKGSGAHNQRARYRHLVYLKGIYGDDPYYERGPWAEVLRRG